MSSKSITLLQKQLKIETKTTIKSPIRVSNEHLQTESRITVLYRVLQKGFSAENISTPWYANGDRYAKVQRAAISRVDLYGEDIVPVDLHMQVKSNSSLRRK